MYHNHIFENANLALPILAGELLEKGQENGSRNGAVKELTHVGTTLVKPWQREILIHPRKVNIAAQIAETAWVLAGRHDLEFLSHYLPRAGDFSDDGETWRAGYGPRLRRWPTDDLETEGVDQIQQVVDLLRADPLTRRAVMSLWDPSVDYADSKDIPCNNWLSFSSRLGFLDLHVAVRSNDLMWGWSGINAFEWSVLQEIVAGMLGLDVGGLHFSTTSLHLYAPHWRKAQKIANTFMPEQAVVASTLSDSPRFNATGVDDTEALDYLLRGWFQVEQDIREGRVHDSQIEDFPERMFKSWLRVLRWWWTGEERFLEPLRGTRLQYAARVAVQPPTRDLREEDPTPLVHLADPEGNRLCGEPGGLETVFFGPDSPATCPSCLSKETMRTIPGRLVKVGDEPTDPVPLGVSPTVNDPDDFQPSPFLRYAIRIHNEKHVAYGDSWKRRGEMLGILANIARKVDRLGGSETSDETSADTAMDLMVYLAKYRTWLDDYTLGSPGENGISATPDAANQIMLDAERQLSPNPRMLWGKKMAEYWFRKTFDRLEDAVNRKDPMRYEIVEVMIRESYRLARHLWEEQQEVLEERYAALRNDEYRGADVD